MQGHGPSARPPLAGMGPPPGTRADPQHERILGNLTPQQREEFQKFMHSTPEQLNVLPPHLRDVVLVLRARGIETDFKRSEGYEMYRDFGRLEGVHGHSGGGWGVGGAGQPVHSGRGLGDWGASVRVPVTGPPPYGVGGWNGVGWGVSVWNQGGGGVGGGRWGGGVEGGAPASASSPGDNSKGIKTWLGGITKYLKKNGVEPVTLDRLNQAVPRPVGVDKTLTLQALLETNAKTYGLVLTMAQTKGAKIVVALAPWPASGSTQVKTVASDQQQAPSEAKEKAEREPATAAGAAAEGARAVVPSKSERARAVVPSKSERARAVVPGTSVMNSKGHPVRPGKKDCPFYMKTGECHFGARCKFNHPERSSDRSGKEETKRNREKGGAESDTQVCACVCENVCVCVCVCVCAI